MKSYRLPGGGHAASVDAYQAAWVELANAALEFFPGYDLFAYDPTIMLNSNLPYATMLRLTVPEAQALRDYRDRKQAEIDALQEEVSLLRAEVRKQVFGSRVVFDREVVARAKKEEGG
jgi:hypothetical protein